MATQFIFGGDDMPQTPQELARLRAIAAALAPSKTPQNVGEGLTSLGNAISYRMMMNRADKAERAGRESANAAFAPLANMFSSGASSGVAQEMGATSPAAVGDMGSYRDAIASIESKGSGDYSAVGPSHPSLGRALGRYQVMEANIGPWSKAALGREVSADEFLQNPQIQDAIFDNQFKGYVDKYGPEGAAQAWFGGPGGVGKLDRKDSLGTSIAAYTDKFRNALGGTEVASLDPSAGITSPQAIEQQAPTQPRQQVAQALTRGADYFPPAPQPPQQGGIDTRAVIQALNNPFLAPGQKAVAEALLQQEQSRRQAILEQQLQQNDPKYQLDLRKGQVELDQMLNPQMSPADEARIGLDREKFDYERNKPQTVPGSSRLVGPDGKVMLDAIPEEPNKPSAILEYEYAKEQGFPGTFQGWEASKKGGMSLQVDPATGAVTFQQGGNIKPMTEGQSKDAVFSTRAEGALPLIDQYGDALTGMEGTVGGTVGQLPVVGNFAKSEGYQQAEQAGKEFLQAILRKDTGAAITSQETSEYGSVYLPRPGDSPAVLQQKKASRLRALEAIKAGMPPQAILAQEKALANTNAATAPASDLQMPEGMDPADWEFLTPEERRLFAK